jgi:predicted DNA-binding ribbon-helix-helix protein
VLTTIRLENLFWDVLAEIAGREGKTTNQMITTLHEELTALREDNGNFTSFLRVCCLRYLAQPGRVCGVRAPRVDADGTACSARPATPLSTPFQGLGCRAPRATKFIFP